MQQSNKINWVLKLQVAQLLKKLSYKQFMLLVLDYASSIWDPYHQNQINQLEMIQHRAGCYARKKR